MKPVEYWLLAKRLIEQDQSPAACRTSISRSYYAAFLTARDLISHAGASLPTGQARNDHLNVKQVLSLTGLPELEQIAQVLFDLRNARTAADYELDDLAAESIGLAESCHDQAGTVVARLTTLASTAVRFEHVSPIIVECARSIREGPRW